MTVTKSEDNFIFCQQEKDLQADPREAELAKQISDCLAIAFDSVLCESRLHEQKRREADKADKSKADNAKSSKDEQNLAVLRGRTHMLIR